MIMHVMVAFLINLSIKENPINYKRASSFIKRQKFTCINHTWTEFCDKNVEII